MLQTDHRCALMGTVNAHNENVTPEHNSDKCIKLKHSTAFTTPTIIKSFPSTHFGKVSPSIYTMPRYLHARTCPHINLRWIRQWIPYHLSYSLEVVQIQEEQTYLATTHRLMYA